METRDPIKIATTLLHGLKCPDSSISRLDAEVVRNILCAIDGTDIRVDLAPDTGSFLVMRYKFCTPARIVGRANLGVPDLVVCGDGTTAERSPGAIIITDPVCEVAIPVMCDLNRVLGRRLLMHALIHVGTHKLVTRFPVATGSLLPVFDWLCDEADKNEAAWGPLYAELLIAKLMGLLWNREIKTVSF